MGSLWGWFALPTLSEASPLFPQTTSLTLPLFPSLPLSMGSYVGTLGSFTESVKEDTMVHNDDSTSYLLLHNKPS